LDIISYKYDVRGKYLEPTVSHSDAAVSIDMLTPPKNHTFVQPPSYDTLTEDPYWENNQWVVYKKVYKSGPSSDLVNPEWDNVASAWVETVSLEEMKSIKKAEIANSRWVAETGGINVNGVHVPTDRESQALITGAAFSAVVKLMKASLPEDMWLMLDQIPSSVNWKASEWMNLPNEQIIQIGMLVRMHVQGVFDREKAISDLITAATTVDDIKAFSWEMILE